ncbi:MAG: hypothetical protein EAZ24_09375 [Burkholderiales bacterium]|nr:MAG: hypothetical protein EAZ24_09375 [Burkholderiales bacterium]TAG84154.1 MAG: hypothetical protein EAZ21_00970 [Betaproteobacteria bacterium]
MRKQQKREIELHDAQLVNLQVDYHKSEITVDVLYYRDPINDQIRVPATLTFRKVTSFSHIADLKQLKTNRAAGDVSNWWSDVDGKTYIYLAGGCMIVEAKSAKFQEGTRS